VNQFKLIALTHRELGLELVGKFHVQKKSQHDTFKPHLDNFSIREFMFVSTCNRVEFFMRTHERLSPSFIEKFLKATYPNLTPTDISFTSERARTYNGLDAVRHVFHVASSLDSLIVGEREIITQIRNAHDLSIKNKLSADFIRIAITKAIETAKVVYTETQIATKPISVVNLGFKRLLERDIHEGQSIAYIGAGTTIEAIAGNMKSLNFKSVKVFNRTLAKAQKLAASIGGEGFGLESLKSELGNTDIIITCTGSESSIIDLEMYSSLIDDNPKEKIILDLAIPNDIQSDVVTQFPIDYISIEDLKVEAKENLKHREKEIFHCEKLVEERLIDFEETFRTRRLELAMREIPRLMKEIKTNALENTFAKELNQMNSSDREKLFEIVNYIENKYISLPMKMAKQVVLDKDLKDAIID
jgi:glutamyl-tRNA reductase